MSNVKKYDENTLQFVIDNINSLTNKELADKLSLSTKTIRYLIDKLKLKRTVKLHQKYNKRIRRNDSRMVQLLLNNTCESFYWIGFILADGWVSGDEYPTRLGISLSMKDEQHLSKLGTYINVPLWYNTKTTNFKENYEYVSLLVNDYINVPIICDKFNINKNKTNAPPDCSNYNFEDDLFLSLIIGYIDGDGSISKRKEKHIISVQTKYAWLSNLQLFLETIHRMRKTKHKSKARVNNRNHAYICITKNDTIAFLKDFAIKKRLPYMSRKWDMI